MTQEKAPDDIFALFCRFDLDVSQYQVFRREAKQVDNAKQVDLARQADSIEVPKQATPPAEQPEVEREFSRPVAAPAPFGKQSDTFRPASSAEPQARREQPVAQRTSLGMRNLFTSLQRFEETSRLADTRRSAISIQLSGATAGVGVTTILAHVARQLSKEGHVCGLYDESPDSILPLFFGMQAISQSQHPLAGLYAALQRPIRFLGPNSLDYQSIQRSQAPREAVSQRFRSEIDFFLYEDNFQAGIDADINVLVALPDLPSVVKVRNLLNRPGARSQAAKTICVLNRFDGDVPLHAELFRWFQQSFAQVVTVRHSYLLPEALAAGSNVCELAPDASVTLDLDRVTEQIMLLSRSQNHSAAVATLAEEFAS